MHEVLVNRLGGLSLPRKSVVRLTDRPDMTLDVYRGRKTTKQKQTIKIGFSLKGKSLLLGKQFQNFAPREANSFLYVLAPNAMEVKVILKGLLPLIVLLKCKTQETECSLNCLLTVQ